MILAWVRVIAVEVRKGEIIDTFGKWSQEDFLTDRHWVGVKERKMLRANPKFLK